MEVFERQGMCCIAPVRRLRIGGFGSLGMSIRYISLNMICVEKTILTVRAAIIFNLNNKPLRRRRAPSHPPHGRCQTE